MKESLLLANPVRSSVSHPAQWEALRENNAGLRKILEAVRQPQGTAVVFSHDDPDGITSGLICRRMLDRHGWRTVLKMPEGFALTPEQFETALREVPDAKAIFISDKGTLPSYSIYGKRFPVYIIDHHPTPEPPAGCAIFNPSLEKYTLCSASLLAHGIAALAGTRDAFDDFLCLLGLKGDWAVEPVNGIVADFAKPFMAEYGQAFRNLYKLSDERPTMFDAEQRQHTCLLSRLAEFVHATGGGGFSYFYHDRDESLRRVDHPACVAAALEKMSDKAAALQSLATLEDFVRWLPEPEGARLKKIYSFFLQDWEKAGRLLDSTAKILQLADTAQYLFVGGKVPLLPMIGSIKLFDLKQAAGDKYAQIIMVSAVSTEYTHVSVRATGDQVHSGKFCGRLAGRLQAKFPAHKDRVSGGGHPRAAECVVRTAGISFRQVLAEVVAQLNEMSEVDAVVRGKRVSEEYRRRAAEWGMDYAGASPAKEPAAARAPEKRRS